MPRYYFDIEDRDGKTVDSDGIELGNLDAAEREARVTLAELARENIPRFDHNTLAISIRSDGSSPDVLLTVHSSIDRGATKK